jgi:hypothetical protein
MISKKKAPPAKRKKPRGEDRNPNDREAWHELARESPTKVAKKKKLARRETR